MATIFRRLLVSTAPDYGGFAGGSESSLNDNSAATVGFNVAIPVILCAVFIVLLIVGCVVGRRLYKRGESMYGDR